MDETHLQPAGITESRENGAREDQSSGAMSTTGFYYLNGAPLVHQLPTELLLYIFQNVLEPLPSPGCYRHVCTLSEVCARWFSVVQNSPQLWTKISAGVKAEGLEKVLQQSSGRLIDITCEISPRGLGQNPEEHLEVFLLTLGVVIERWRTLALKYSGNAHKRLIKKVLQLPASNLQRLVLDDQNTELDISDIVLFGGDCPDLKDVSVVGMDCGWSQAVFKGLENLRLSWVTFDSVGPILDILRDCPQLRKLEICECQFFEDIPPVTQPILLPNLQILHIEVYEDVGPTSATDQLLNTISAPLHCALYTAIFSENDKEDSLRTRFEKWLFGRQPQTILEGLDGLELQLGRSQVPGCLLEFTLSSGCSVIKGGSRVWDKRAAIRAMEAIENVRQRSHGSKMFTTLKISGSKVKYLENRDFVSQFNRLPPISHLELIGPHSLSEHRLITNVLCGLGHHPISHLATIRHLSFREMHPEFVANIVQAALANSETDTRSNSESKMDSLDRLEMHVSEQDFKRAEQVVKTLRGHPRIGKVDLFVVL